MFGTTLPTCHPDRNEMEWRDLLKWQVLPYAGNFCYLGRFLHSACAAVGMTFRGVVPFTHTGCFCNVSRNGTQAVLYGFAGRWILFNHTGYICNVAACLPPLQCVVLCNTVWSIRLNNYNVPGGRFVAPTIHLFRITMFSTCIPSFCVCKISKTWCITVGAAICRPPRFE